MREPCGAVLTVSGCRPYPPREYYIKTFRPHQEGSAREVGEGPVAVPGLGLVVL